jgi:tRNA-dihydrouridine synthase
MYGPGPPAPPCRKPKNPTRLYGAPRPDVPEGRALTEVVQEHYEAMIAFYGPELGVKCARKHLGWYMDHAGTAPEMRRRVLTERDPAQALALLRPALEDALMEAA